MKIGKTSLATIVLLAGAVYVNASVPAPAHMNKVLTPANSKAIIDLQGPVNGTPGSVVTDMRGHRVGALTQESPTRFSWDARNMASGMYLLKINDASWAAVVAFVK